VFSDCGVRTPDTGRVRYAMCADPSRWVDLPEAPFIAQMREGVPVLVTRSKQTFSQIKVGCVVERDGKRTLWVNCSGNTCFTVLLGRTTR
jgi:hypothetical protein